MTAHAELALYGGPKTVPDGLKRRWPDIRAEDKAAILDVLDRGELTGVSGIEATGLEREWAERIGVAHAVLFNSGTAAIHAALYAVGVEAGDEVITTAFTFSGTFQAILHQSAIPVFVDIDPATYNIDPSLIEARITPRTRALLPVHIHGMPCDMEAILETARRHSLVVVEDAAQAHLATYRGRYAGTMGLAGAFSIQATKNLSGVEGGFVVTDDNDVADRARRIRRMAKASPMDRTSEAGISDPTRCIRPVGTIVQTSCWPRSLAVSSAGSTSTPPLPNATAGC